MPAKTLRALLCLLLAGHLAGLLAHFHASYASPDASGTFVQARRIADDGALTLEAESPLRYFGVPWLETEDGRFVSRYPPGLAAALAVVRRVAGPTATLLVNPILATLTVLLVFLIVRRFAGDGGGLLAALLLAVVPVANRQALHADSHTAAAFLLTAGVLLLMRWRERPSAARAVAAGLVLGVLPTVRYAEGLAAVGIALFLLLETGRGRAPRSHLVAAAAGALVPIVPLLVVHHRLLGSPFRTAYDLTHEQTAFAADALLEHAAPYLASFSREAVGPWLAIGLLGAIGLLSVRRERSVGALVLGACVPLGALYLSYYWGAPGEPTNRFFVPLVPLLLLGGFAALARFDAATTGAGRTIARGVLTVAVLVQAAVFAVESERRLAREEIGLARGASVEAWLAEHAEADDVVIANRAVQGALEREGRYRLVDDRLVPGGPRRAVVKTRNPNLRFLQDRTDGASPSPHQHDKAASLRRRYEGKSDREQAALVLDDLRAWADGRAVWWLATREEIDRFIALAPAGTRFEPAGEIDLPTPESRLLDLVDPDFDPTARRLPYWVIEPPLSAWRWAE